MQESQVQAVQLLKNLSVVIRLNKDTQQGKQQIRPKFQALSSQQVSELIKMFKISLSQKNHKISHDLIEVLKAAFEFSKTDAEWTFDKQDFDNFARYISEFEQNLEQSIALVEIIYLEKGNLKIAQSESLFKALLLKITLLKGQKLQILVEILVQMLKDNKKLIPLANKPYIFLEYWIHCINQCTNLVKTETQPDRKVYWIDSVKLLYENQKAQQYLFYRNDFRTFVDILLSTLQNANQPIVIKKCLQCYLILTCTNIIKEEGRYYRLDELKLKMQQNDVQHLGIEKEAQQILTIK